MDQLRPVELKLVDELFGMSSGYVLDFLNSTFADFFEREIGINIYDDAYAIHGSSKGTLVERGFQGGKVQVETAVGADHHGLAVLCGDGLAGLGAGQRQVHRLFAEDGLASPGGAFDQVGMGVGRGRDQDNVNLRVVEDRLRRARFSFSRKGVFAMQVRSVWQGRKPKSDI